MRILRVSQHLYPDVTGGMPYHVHAMSRDQAEMGHEVTVVTTRTDDDLPRIEERDGYEIRRFDTLVSPLGNDISVGLARYLRQASEFDVIHAHSHLYFSTNLAALKRRLGHIPLAITNHGLYSQNAPEQLFRWYLWTIGRWTFNQSDIIFCYTDEDRNRLLELGVSSRVDVVQNGIDINRFTPEGPECDFEGEPVVLFVGRLVEGKHPRVAIEVIERVADEYPNIKLVICGDGPLRERLESEAGPRVTFLGSIPYDDMPAVYRGGDLLVHPSRAEGTPRTIMEALASGIPVVSADLKQIRSAFGDNLIYVDLNSNESYWESIVNELDREWEYTLHERFSWDRTVAEMTEILEMILEQPQ